MATDNKDFSYIYEATHRIYYTTEKPVPLKEMIIALQGLEGVLKPLPKLLEGLTGVKVEGCEFLIDRIESGSLLEEVVIRFLFKDRANLDAFVDKMRDNPGVKTTVITIAIAALVGYGLHLAMGEKPAPQINATNSVIIQNGAGQLNIHPDALKAAIRDAAVDKKAVAEGALRFISPARSDNKATIELGDGFVIPQAVVAEAPGKLELEPNERHEEFVGTVLTLRAANLDSKKTGWAGRLGNRDERLPIELDPTVNESEIFGRTTVMVDAALIYKEKGRSRELKASRIYVRRVHHSKS